MAIFKQGDVLLGDCYYPSFFLMATLIALGVDAAFPSHSARRCDFRCGKRLAQRDHLIEWKKPTRPKWMDKETYKTFPNSITVREAQISHSQPGVRTKSRVIVTTFLTPAEVSKADLAELYHYRWQVEINFLAIKQTMQMDILRCKTPEMIHKEVWMHLLAYNLIRKIMAQAAMRHGKIPRQLSFKLTLQVVFAFQQANLFGAYNELLYEKMLKAVAYKKVGNRPGRSEPRRVKRRPKSFPRLQKPRQYYTKKAA